MRNITKSLFFVVNLIFTTSFSHARDIDDCFPNFVESLANVKNIIDLRFDNNMTNFPTVLSMSVLSSSKNQYPLQFLEKITNLFINIKPFNIVSAKTKSEFEYFISKYQLKKENIDFINTELDEFVNDNTKKNPGCVRLDFLEVNFIFFYESVEQLRAITCGISLILHKKINTQIKFDNIENIEILYKFLTEKGFENLSGTKIERKKEITSFFRNRLNSNCEISR